MSAIFLTVICDPNADAWTIAYEIEKLYKKLEVPIRLQITKDHWIDVGKFNEQPLPFDISKTIDMVRNQGG